MPQSPLVLAQCSACKELLGVRDFSTEGTQWTFVCGMCLARTVVRPQPGVANAALLAPGTLVVAQEAPVVAPDAQEETVKALVANALSVAQAAAVSPPPDEDNPRMLTAEEELRIPPSERGPMWDAWRVLLPSWEDPKAHDRFVALAARVNALPFAGTRYRERLEANKEDVRAKYGRDRVLGQAMAMAAATRTEAPVQSRRTRQYINGGALVVLFLLMAWTVSALVKATQSMGTP